MPHLFISYASRDDEFKEEFDAHTAVLRRTGGFTAYQMTDNVGSEAWHLRVQQELRNADIVVMLLSPDFFRSDYIWTHEFINTIARWKEGKVKVAGIVVRPCDWQKTDLKDIHLLAFGQAISTATNRDALWVEVVNDLRKML